MGYKVEKGKQYTVMLQKSGISAKNNKRWQFVVPTEADKITVFIDNDIDLATGDMFIVEKINAITFKVAKNGDKIYHNAITNCEVKKVGGGIDSIGDIDDLDDVDVDKVIT